VGNGGFAVAHPPGWQAEIEFRLLDECIALLNNAVLTSSRDIAVQG
jgi:hypothetical protein